MTDRLNELLYKKSILERKSYCTQIDKKDRKFYRKRILNLTRELFVSSTVANDNVNDAFMNYIHYCVEHFKNIDTNDILQSEYNVGMDTPDLEADSDVDAESDLDADAEQVEMTMSSYDSSILRKIIKPNTLDNFIIRNIIKKNTPEYLPVQKEINLKDPQLRVKGISKKKNLMNTYDESEDTEKKENALSDKKIQDPETISDSVPEPETISDSVPEPETISEPVSEEKQINKNVV